MNQFKFVFFTFFLMCFTFSSFAEEEQGYYEKSGHVFYNGNYVTTIEYQKNADIIRLRHLRYYGLLLEEYYQKAGHYPFQNQADIPIYIYVANSMQINDTEHYANAIPFEHKTLTFSDLVKEIESVLGREIEEYYDPQYEPDAKWNWYLYSVQKDVFYFAVHVHQRFPFSKFISPYNYKIEISNQSNQSANLIIKTAELLESDLFIKEADKKVFNVRYFEEREQLFLHETRDSE